MELYHRNITIVLSFWKESVFGSIVFGYWSHCVRTTFAFL